MVFEDHQVDCLSLLLPSNKQGIKQLDIACQKIWQKVGTFYLVLFFLAEKKLWSEI